MLRTGVARKPNTAVTAVTNEQEAAAKNKATEPHLPNPARLIGFSMRNATAAIMTPADTSPLCNHANTHTANGSSPSLL